jgi:hypothetical protein
MMTGAESPLNQIHNQELTPGIVTTSVNKSNNLVTHDEAFEFSEDYHTGWEEIEQYWNNMAGLGVGAIIVGVILGFLGLGMSNISLMLAAGLLIVGGIIAIGYALERLKFIKTGKEYMLKTNIRIRSK